jgi:hypothetical protein
MGSSPPPGSEGLSNPEEVKGGRRPTFIHLINPSDVAEHGYVFSGVVPDETRQVEEF